MASYDLTVMMSDSVELKSADTMQYFNTGVFIVNRDAYNKVDIDRLALNLNSAQILKYAD
jgi:lipopolysaccharide biosynthesis glycosyltransferase